MAMSTQRLILTMLFMNIILGLAHDIYDSNISAQPSALKVWTDRGNMFTKKVTLNIINFLPEGVQELVKSTVNTGAMTISLILFIVELFFKGAFGLLYGLSDIMIGATSLEKMIITVMGLFITIFNLLLGLEIFLVWKANKGT